MTQPHQSNALEPGRNDTTEFDAIFVGAGINSLGAAFLLGRAGWRVLVVDRNDEPGGAIRTLELTLPGFRHDIGAMNLTIFANSPFYQAHKDALSSKGFGFVTADRSAGSVFPDGTFLGVTTDQTENSRAIARFSTADVKAWQEWNSDFDRCAPYLFEIYGAPTPPADALGYVFGAQSGVPEDVLPILRGILLESLRTNLSARFESEAVRALVGAWGLHPDYAPDIAGGCVYPFLETNFDARQGISIVKGGSGRLIHALADLIRDDGGEVRTATTVDKIVIEGGRATGIQLADGEIVHAQRGVVASVTPKALSALTGEQLPNIETKRAQKWRHGPGTMVIHLALSELPNWQADDARRSFYVSIAPTLDYLARAYQECLAGQLSAEPFCVVAQPTIYDPSRAPAGGHVLWIMVRCVPAVIKGDVAGKIEGTAWTEDVKEAFADRVLDLVESYAPGLRDNILAKTIHSPSDLENLNPNLVGGDINGGSCHLDQFYGQRPFPRYPHHKMPISGLYMCGASTWPGAGASPGSGTFVAEQLLSDNA